MGESDSGLSLRSAAGRGVLGAAVLASGMAFLDSTVVNVALPHLGAELDATVADLQWVITGYTLTLAAFVLLGGALGDRFGRRRIFLIGVVWFAVASLACGLAANVEMLIAARIVQGIGAALLTPGSLSLLQASFRRADRGRAIGLWSGLSGVTTALGPFLGGVLIDQASWRWIFLINLPLAAVVCWLAWRCVPESRDTELVTRFDVTGAALCASALGGLTYALIAWPERGFGSVHVLLPLGAAVATGVGFVWWERARGVAAMLPMSLFHSRVFSGLNAYTLLVYGSFGGMFLFLVLFLQNAAGWSALAAGVSTVPITLMLLIFSGRSGALATRIGPTPQLVIGPLCCAAGALLLSRIGMRPDYWTDLLPGVLMFGAGLATFVAPLTAATLGAVADRHAGLASGVSNTSARAASLLMIAALPLLVGLTGDQYAQPEPLAHAYRLALYWCAALLVAGAGLALLTRPRECKTLNPAG